MHHFMEAALSRFHYSLDICAPHARRIARHPSVTGLAALMRQPAAYIAYAVMKV